MKLIPQRINFIYTFFVFFSMIYYLLWGMIVLNCNNSVIFLEDLIKLHGSDLSNVDFTNVMILPYDSLKNITLPNDVNLFQKIFNKSLRYVHMGDKNYERYNFNEVDLYGAIFDKNAKIPNNKDFFIKLFDKSIENVVLPEHDFSTYIFKEVNLKGAFFQKNSKLPKHPNFFQ